MEVVPKRGEKSDLGVVLIINELAKKLQKSAKIFGKTLAGFKKVTTFASAIEKQTTSRDGE